ncbi:MAG: reverse transcriptase domain-containing protein [Polyangiaceae bacterium]
MEWVALAVLLIVAGYLLPKIPRKLRELLARDRFDVAELSQRLDVPEAELRSFEPRYRRHDIGKRGVNYRVSPVGKRRLHIPDDETKALQRKILRRLLRKLKVHRCATAFEPGCSVAENAAAHAYQAVVIKLDIVGFFDHTSAARVQAYFRAIGWTKEAAELLTSLTTHEGCLPQGAPTSPALSNRLNLRLDEAIWREVRWRGGTYTRYADDLTISFPYDRYNRRRGLAAILTAVPRIVSRYGYTLHRDRKRKVLRRQCSQRVTGLVVNDGVRLPRETRRWLRAVQHRMDTGGEPTLRPEELAGWRAYQAHVDAVRARTEAEERARLDRREGWLRHEPVRRRRARALGIPDDE